MYKKIMVAVDGSSIGGLALQESLKLAIGQEGVILQIVYVVNENILDYGELAFDLSDLFTQMKTQGQQILKEAIDIVQEFDVRYETFLIELTLGGGSIADRLLEQAKTHGADLLVLGTHGRRGFNRFFLGSVAEQVIRQATIPVLLVRGKEDA